MTTQHPTVDFDLFGAVTPPSSDASWVEPREHCPVAWSERHGGFWVISGYDEVAAAFRDWEHFSSARTDPEVSSIVLGAEPPPAADARGDRPARLVPGAPGPLGAAGAPGRRAAAATRAEHWTTHFIDQFIEAGECEFTHELSVPVPGAVTLEWLGFPEDDWRMITDAFHDVAAYSARHPRARAAQAAVRQRDGAHPRGGRRCASTRPRDDAMSAITHHEIDGERIPRETAESIVFMTVGGGVDTTTALIGAALLHLSQFPDDKPSPARRARPARDRDRGVPPLLPAGPHARPHRHRRLRVRGLPDAQGRPRAAQRDLVGARRARRFPDADAFVIDRNPNRHLSFGVGIHRCVGSHLARIEFAEVHHADPAAPARLRDRRRRGGRVPELGQRRRLGQAAGDVHPREEERPCMTS